MSDIDQTAEAIRAALEMAPEEKQSRMQRMRKTVREHDVFFWAGSLMAELSELRLDNHVDRREGYQINAAAAAKR